MKQVELKRKSGLKPGRRRRSNPGASAGFWRAARDQGWCAVTHTRGPWDPHHVIERQWLHSHDLDEWDPRNALRVIRPVHAQHTLAVKRIPLCCLTDENLQFAFEVMGLAAHVYLHRRYRGDDPRVETFVAQFGAPDACG